MDGIRMVSHAGRALINGFSGLFKCPLPVSAFHSKFLVSHGLQRVVFFRFCLEFICRRVDSIQATLPSWSGIPPHPLGPPYFLLNKCRGRILGLSFSGTYSVHLPLLLLTVFSLPAVWGYVMHPEKLGRFFFSASLLFFFNFPFRHFKLKSLSF